MDFGKDERGFFIEVTCTELISIPASDTIMPASSIYCLAVDRSGISAFPPSKLI